MRFKKLFEHEHPELQRRIADFGLSTLGHDQAIDDLYQRFRGLENRVEDLEQNDVKEDPEGIPWPNPSHKPLPPKSRQGSDWDREAERQFETLWDEFLEHTAAVTGRTQLAIWYHLKNSMSYFRP